MADVTASIMAALAVEDDGNEGLCAFMNADGQWMPLVAADAKNFPSIEHMAELVSYQSGKTIRIVEFSARQVTRIITPKDVR